MENIPPASASHSPNVFYGNGQASDEIDLREILFQLWQKRRFILIVAAVFLFLGIFTALFSPVKYTASCTIVPQMRQRTGGNLGGLAALAGINLGNNMSGEILSPSVYPEIIKSVPFTRAIMQLSFSPDAAGGKEITLYEFYTDKKYNKTNLISGIKKYTVGLPGVIASSIKKKNDIPTSGSVADTLKTIEALNAEEKKVYKIIQANTSFQANAKEGYIQLQDTFPEAEGAALITDCLQKTLERFVIDYKLEKVQEELLFVEKNYEEAQKDFLRKQENLAAFQDSNRGLITATGRTTESRLRSEYDIAFTVYSELAKQREQARIAVKENKPVLTVINPVVIPSEKSAPRKAMIIAVFLFMGLTIGVGWTLAKPYLKEITRKINEEKSIK